MIVTGNEVIGPHLEKIADSVLCQKDAGKRGDIPLKQPDSRFHIHFERPLYFAFLEGKSRKISKREKIDILKFVFPYARRKAVHERPFPERKKRIK